MAPIQRQRHRGLIGLVFLGATRSIEPMSYGNVADWLAGWLGGWLSVTAGIVSKRLNLS